MAALTHLGQTMIYSDHFYSSYVLAKPLEWTAYDS